VFQVFQQIVVPAGVPAQVIPILQAPAPARVQVIPTLQAPAHQVQMETAIQPSKTLLLTMMYRITTETIFMAAQAKKTIQNQRFTMQVKTLSVIVRPVLWTIN